MSVKNTTTTADYMEWNSMLNLVHRLYRDKDYTMSLLIGCGAFFGLRISDLLGLKWEMIMSDTFTLTERKTKKKRTIKVNENFQKHILDCYKAMAITDKTDYCFKSRKGTVFSTQRINVKLKYIKVKYGLKINNISTHTLRKTFGRKVFESAGEQSEMALVRLMELFNHSSVAITKRYLGIRQQELMETYSLLNF